jgi:hypothetical protein
LSKYFACFFMWLGIFMRTYFCFQAFQLPISFHTMVNNWKLNSLWAQTKPLHFVHS